MNQRQLEIQMILDDILEQHYFSMKRDPNESWYKIKYSYDPINEYLVLNGNLDPFLLAKLTIQLGLFISDRVLIPCFRHDIPESTIEKRIELRVIETRSKHRKETK